MRLDRAARLILIGAPGVGKGTQTNRLVKRFPQFAHISSGDLLRDNVRRRTALGIAAESRMKAGELVPDGMILRLIVHELKQRGYIEADHQTSPYSLSSTGMNAGINTIQPVDSSSIFLDPLFERDEQYIYSNSPESSFILDGFPRTSGQANQVDRVIPVNVAINIVTPTEIILDRICNRWVHERSNRIYNTTFNPPKVPGIDDITGERLTRRADDDPEVWKSRLASFSALVQPLLEHYDKRGLLVTVKGDSSDEITPKLLKEVEKRFCLPLA